MTIVRIVRMHILFLLHYSIHKPSRHRDGASNTLALYNCEHTRERFPFPYNLLLHRTTVGNVVSPYCLMIIACRIAVTCREQALPADLVSRDRADWFPPDRWKNLPSDHESS